jgi:hypothetical protein
MISVFAAFGVVLADIALQPVCNRRRRVQARLATRGN